MANDSAYDEVGDDLSSVPVNPYQCFPRRQFDRELAVDQVAGDLPWFVDLVCGLITGLDDELEQIRTGRFKVSVLLPFILSRTLTSQCPAQWSMGSLAGMRGACLNLGFNTLAWMWHVSLTANNALRKGTEDSTIWCDVDFSHAYLDHFHEPLPKQPLTVTELALIRDELPAYAKPELEHAREVLAQFLTTIERSFIKILVQGVHTATIDQPLGRLRAHPLFDPNVLLEIDELLTGIRKCEFLTSSPQPDHPSVDP